MRERYRDLPPLAPDLPRRLENLEPLFRRHPVRLAYLFGSVARGDPKAADVDLAVLPEEGCSIFPLYADLSIALGTDRVDLVDLQSAPLYLKQEILQTGRCVFARSEAERQVFEQRIRDTARDTRTRVLAQAREFQWGLPTMALRWDFLWSALLELERVADALEPYRVLTAHDLETDLHRRWAAERGLLAGLTLIFQIADHILVARFHYEAETYEDLLRALRREGVITETLYDRLRGAGGFRNILVHEYVRIDPARVVEFLEKAPEVFRRFASEVRTWLSELPHDEFPR
ncbi:MAG: DUF86 domain-containing protein [Anaerolineae bacterium]|uniref:type VII toxin-antitoxin system HepT family RNase toxin n=1 Tax=Thermoflexus sp. TaxID=1969742 RepID=UPI0025E2A2AA|nr:HepT-like ribonuclease domain-containing protein [Thermoflexus sp.]MCS7350801.1 DUF86 domain-containing protein [Thermoflexus sp.]MDW8180252.1 DUF86 domain-containing protein [Anaerolineae bacterium]